MIQIASKETIKNIISGFDLPVPDIMDPETTYAVYLNEVPVAIGGCPQIWEGFGQTWGIVNEPLVAGHGIWFTRQTRKALETVINKMNYRQVRAQCFGHKAVRFNIALGFQIEGVWKNAGPEGEHVFIMVYHRRH